MSSSPPPGHASPSSSRTSTSPPPTSATMATTSKPPFLLIPANNAHYTKHQNNNLTLPNTSSLPIPNPPATHVHFKAPAHIHSHHIHHIPPRHKSTRSLILDQMIHEQHNTRLASVRAELGLSSPSSLAAAEKEDGWKQRHFALPFVFDEHELAIDFASQNIQQGGYQGSFNAPRVPNTTLAMQLHSKAQGISNVVRATVSQPPHPLTHSTTHSHHQHHHHDDRIPNGVRFRLLLAILTDVYFCPRGMTSSTEPSSEIPAYLANLVALSSFKLAIQPQHPTLPGIKSFLNTSPSSGSSSPASPFTSFTASGVSPRTQMTPTFFGQQPVAPPRKNSSGSGAVFGSFAPSFGKAPPPRSNTGDSTSSVKSEGGVPGSMASAPFPKSMQMQTGWQLHHEKSSNSIAPSSASQVFATPITRSSASTRCSRHLRSSCQSPSCPSTSSAFGAYKKQSIIGAGLETKSLAPLASGVVAGEPHTISALKIFLRLSALVCAEAKEDSRRAAEHALREGSPMSDSESSSSDSEDEAPTPSPMKAASETSSRKRRASPVAFGGDKYLPQREWYALLCGLVTRAVLEGYLLHGWKDTKALEILFGLGNATSRPHGSEAVSSEEHGEHDPDGLLGLRESYWSLFSSSSEGSDALKEFRAEMARRREEFLNIRPGTETTLEAHLVSLNERYTSESVERQMIRFCEGCGRWKGAGELDPPSATAKDALSSGISTVSTASTGGRSGGAVKIWFAPSRKLSVNTRLANAPTSSTVDKNAATPSTGSKRARSGSLSPLSPSAQGRERKKERV